MLFQKKEVDMEKYELREGEKLIKEYIDNEGKPVIIFKDKDGAIMHGWVLDLDDETAKIIAIAAATAGMKTEDYVIFAIEMEMKRIIKEQEKRKAIEEISD